MADLNNDNLWRVNYTVVELRTKLRLLGLHVSGRKIELIHRLKDDLASTVHRETSASRLENFKAEVDRIIAIKRNLQVQNLPILPLQEKKGPILNWHTYFTYSYLASRIPEMIVVKNPEKLKQLFLDHKAVYGEANSSLMVEHFNWEIVENEPFFGEIDALEEIADYLNLNVSALSRLAHKLMVDPKTPIDPKKIRVDKIKVSYDSGIPKFELESKSVILRTPPYGLKIDVASAIVAVDGMSVSEYLDFTKDEIAEWQMRKFMKLMADYHKVLEVHDIANRMDVCRPYNLNSIIKKIAGPETTIAKFNLYLAQMPEPLTLCGAGRKILATYLQNLEKNKNKFFIEDLVQPATWATLPKIFEKLTLPVKLVENPYHLLPIETLRYFYRMYIPDFTVPKTQEEAAETLYQLEKIEHRISENFHTLLRLEVKKSRPYRIEELQFYYACQGISIPRYDSTKISWSDLVNLLEYASAVKILGGLGEDAATANQIVHRLMLSIQLSEPTKSLLAKLLKIEGGGLLEIKDLYLILNRGHIHPLPIKPEIMARILKWKNYSPIQQEIAAKIYKDPTMDASTFAIAKYNGMEFFVDRYMKEETMLLGFQAGMWIPPNQEVERYFIENIAGYGAFFKRIVPSKTLEELSDEEILKNKIGGYIAYHSRHSLIVEAERFEKGDPGFFVPFERECLNAQTLTCDDTKDKNLFLIAYGRSDAYHCYNLQELTMGFAPLNDVYAYRVPSYDPKVPEVRILPRDSRCLVNLINIYKIKFVTDIEMINEFDGLIEAIKIVDEHQKAANDYERNIYEQFLGLRLARDLMDLIETFLTKAFYLGMYMRQWKGPGHPFPYTEKETQGRMEEKEDAYDFASRVLDVEMTPRLLEINGIKDKINEIAPNAMKFIEHLKIVMYRNNVAEQVGGDSFGTWLDDACNGKQCVRMASSRIVMTTAHYLILFFNKVIDGFDPRLITLVI